MSGNRADHYFIYPRDKRGERTGHTICVILRDGNMFHGETLCSDGDQFSKKQGRLLSFDRAVASYKRYLLRLNYINDDGN